MKRWLIAVTAGAGLTYCAAAAAEVGVAALSLYACADQAWDVTWARFYKGETHLFYDYLSSYESGCEQSHLPTAAEVARQYPNPCGYGTGMEDCMISAGIMMSLLIDRYAVTKDETLRERADTVYQGIRLCATVHGVPGFVARGVCPEDRKGIYLNSSRDQYTHAVHGLWLYFHSPLCSAEKKEEIRRILASIADRMTRNVTPENNYDSLRADGTHDTLGISRMWEVKGHEAARLPMIYAAAWDTTGRQEYRDLWRTYLEPAIKQSFIVGERQPAYVYLQMQTSLELLDALEQDSELKKQIRSVMAMVSARCALHAAKVDKNAQALDLTLVGPDWRKSGNMGDYRKSWNYYREIGETALAQLMDADGRFPEEQQALLAHALSRLDYKHISGNGIFSLQAAYWKAQRKGLFPKSVKGK